MYIFCLCCASAAFFIIYIKKPINVLFHVLVINAYSISVMLCMFWRILFAPIHFIINLLILFVYRKVMFIGAFQVCQSHRRFTLDLKSLASLL